MKKTTLEKKNEVSQIDEEKRDFLFVTTAGLAAAGGAATAISLINTMNPAKDVLALSTTEVDLSPVEEGQSLTVMWRGKPIFIRHRSKEEIESAANVSVDQLAHKETDESRVDNPKWLVVVGVCTHLGCAPTHHKGDFEQHVAGVTDGFFCPCHGSKFDMAGRVFQAVPAPLNLEIPPYTFIDDTTILVGEEEVA